MILVVFSEYAKQKNWNSIANGWITLTKFSIFLCVPIFSFILWNAKPIISILYSESYLEAVILFQSFGSLFLISILFGGGANSTVLLAMNKEKIVLYLRAMLGLLNILLDIILIPKYGAMGAIVATGLSTILIIFGEYKILIKKVNIHYPLRFLIKIIIAAVIGLVIISRFQINGITSLIFLLSVFIILFIMSLYFLKPFNKFDQNMAIKIGKPIEKFILLFSEV